MFGPFGIVIAVVICVTAVLYAWYVETRAQGPDHYVAPPHHEERLVVLDRQAIEQAYVQQATHLFLTWMKDDTDQPERALRGIHHARRAYVSSIDAIERREKK